MGLLERMRRTVDALRGPDLSADVEAELAAVRRAIRAEAQRRGTRTGLSLTLMMEHTAEDLRRVDLFQILAHLHAEGELARIEQDSFGNVKFDVAELADEEPRV